MRKFLDIILFATVLIFISCAAVTVYPASTAQKQDKIVIPSGYGEVKDRFDGKSEFTVIHIQDAHCVYEAQKNIAAILESLVKDQGVSLITVEGAADKIEVSEYSSFPDPKIRKVVTDYLMKQGKISGAEYFMITSGAQILMTGLEDRLLYQQNLAQFQQSLSFKIKCGEIFLRLKRVQKILEDKYYPAPMKKMIDVHENYNSGAVSLVDYVESMFSLAREANIDISEYRNLSSICRINRLEKNMDFTSVDTERQQIINAVCTKITGTGLQKLMQYNLQFKLQQVSVEEFHNYLAGLMDEYGIDRSDYREFDKFREYLSIYKSLNWNELSKESENIFDKLARVYFHNDSHARIHQIGKSLDLLDQMYQFSLPVHKFSDYLKSKDELEPQKLYLRIKDLAADAGVDMENIDIKPLVDALVPVEDFYNTAKKRDDALMARLVGTMRNQNVTQAVFIAGGFHTQGIVEFLRSNDISYQVVVPRITKAPDSTPYMSLITNKQGLFEMYLEKSALAISSWLEKNPLSAPNRQYSFGYKMKALMVGAYSYSVAQEEPLLSRQNSEYLKQRITAILERWGKHNYANIDFINTSFVGPFLNITMMVNGKEVNLLFTDREQEGKAIFESPQGANFEILFNSSGEINLLEEDNLGSFHFQVITPKALQSLVAYGDALDNRSAHAVQEYIKQNMEYLLIELLMEKNIEGPAQFEQMLAGNNINLSENELAGILKNIGISDAAQIYASPVAGSIANDTLLGAYLGVKARQQSLMINNRQLPAKAADSFLRLGFESIYIEEGASVNIVRDLFRKLSAGEIDITEKLNTRLYVGADKTGAYFLSIILHNAGDIFLKLERLAGTSPEFTPKFDPNVVERIASSTSRQIERMDVLPIHGARLGVSHVSIKGDEMTISIIEIDRKMNFFRTGIETKINLKKDFAKIESAFRFIKESAANNDIVLTGVLSERINAQSIQGYFPTVNDFLASYFTDLVKLEAGERLAQNYGKPVNILEVQKTAFGFKDKLSATKIVYEVDGTTYTDYVTEKQKRNSNGNRFNIGLPEFLAERFRNIPAESKELIPSEKLIVTLNNLKYTFIREATSTSIRMVLTNGAYSTPLSDGELEYIRASIAKLPRNAIEHIAGYVIPTSSTASSNAIFWDAWRKRSQPLRKESVMHLENDVVPFMARTIFNYEDYLTKYFGGQITFLDLFGHQGSMVDKLITRQSQHDTRMEINPYIIDSDLFDAAMAKKVLGKFGLERERVVSFGFGSNVSRNINSLLHNLQEQNQLSKPIIPQVVSMVGSGLDYGITSYEDAYQLCTDVYKLIPVNGLLFVAGTDFLSLKAEDFEKIGFEVAETGILESFFNPKVFPKQYYVLRKTKTPKPPKSGRIKPQPIQKVVSEKRILKPAKDVFDLVAKLNTLDILFTLTADNQQYKVSIVPKIRVERPNGTVGFSTDFTKESLDKSVDGKVYLDFFLTGPDRVSLMPVMAANVDLALENFQIEKVSLESVNFNGMIKDMRGMGFTSKLANHIYSLLPEMSYIQINSSINYEMVISLFETIPSHRRVKHSSLMLQLKRLQEAIEKGRMEDRNVNKIVAEINKLSAPLLNELASMVKDPEIMAEMNKNLLIVSEFSPIRDYINAGYDKIQLNLSPDRKNLTITGQKVKPSLKTIALGSLRDGFMDQNGFDQTEEIELVRQKLLQVEAILVNERIVSEGYFKTINFKIIDRAKTQIVAPSEPNTIVLDYSLFVKGISNIELLLLEIKQGLMRFELEQINAQNNIKPINRAVMEFYLLLNYVQNFIDIREKNPDIYNGRANQSRILQMLDREFGSNERSLFYLLRYVNEQNIKSAWLIKNIIIDLITAKGEFKDYPIYPESVRTELENMNPYSLVNEINRIMELYDYSYIKRSVTISPTCIYNLNTRAQMETTVKQIIDSEDVQVTYLKIQNFKDVFNTFGSDIGVGHSFGDLGIFIIGRHLRELLEAQLGPLGIKVNMGNSGGEFFITFSNLGNLDIVKVLSDILVSPDSAFKQEVIAEIKDSLRDQIGAQAYQKISDLIESEFTPRKLNFYVGVSEHAEDLQDSGIAFSEKVSKAVVIADRLYAQAFQAAKHQQIQFSPNYKQVRAKLLESGLALSEKNRSELEQMLKLAAKALKTGIMLYTPEIAQEISKNIEIGMANDYEFFQKPLSEVYTWYNSIDVLSGNYLSSIEKQSGYEVLSELKDRILETVLLYKSRFLTDEYIYQGSDNFRRVINYIVNQQPDHDISRTFRLGGDEYGKIVWNSQTKNLRIYRLDGNNVGATNLQWGKEIGDKLIDESLRIVAQTNDISQLSRNIIAFFNDMGERGLKLTEEELNKFRLKAIDTLVIDEDNYNLIKQNGTFIEFTKNNSAVVVRKKDGSFLLVKFPDINVPLLIQKAETKFDISSLPYTADGENALPITLLAGEDVIDFIIVRDESGGIVLESRNPRAPSKVIVSQNDIDTGQPVKIPVQGFGDITVTVTLDYGSRHILSAPIITLNEREYQRVKLAKDKLVEKDGNLAVMVKSRPVVSGGYIDIDTRKIEAQYLNRDISIIERRADSAGEEAKASVKLFQILHDGEIRHDFTLRETQNKFSGNKREMMSFNDIEPSNWDILVSRFILEEPKDKITRRLDYFLNKNIKLEANDIYVLTEIYFMSNDMLNYHQKTSLLERLIDFYSITHNDQRKLIVSALEQILMSYNRDIWMPAVDLFIKVLTEHDKSFDTISAFTQAINRVALNPPNSKLANSWTSNPPVTMQDWIKSLIDTHEVGVLENLKSLTIPQLKEVFDLKSKFLPLAKQYRQLYIGGRILKSESLDPRHEYIMDSVNLIDAGKIEQGYEFAYNKVKNTLSSLIKWRNVTLQDQQRIIDVIVASRIIEDSVFKITGKQLDLGEVENINIEFAKSTKTYDIFRYSIEKPDGSVISGFLLNLVRDLDNIEPDQLRKYYTSASMNKFVSIMDKINRINPNLVEKTGGFYEFSAPNSVTYRVLVTRDKETPDSDAMIASAKNNFWGDRLQHEIQDIAIRDIISYMGVWDILGRNMFLKCPYPVNISSGKNIRNVEMIDTNVSAYEILDRLYKGYQQYNQDELIPNSIVEYFHKYDPEGENAGYAFLMDAYVQMVNLGKKKDFVAQEILSYLNKRKSHLETQLKTKTKLSHNELAQLVRLLRLTGVENKKSKHLNTALFWLEKFVISSQQNYLNYDLWKNTVIAVTAKVKGGVMDSQLLGDDLMMIFKDYGYDPMEELKSTIDRLRRTNWIRTDDATASEMLDKIEELESIVGMKSPQNYVTISDGGLYYEVHPYNESYPLPDDHLGELGFDDSIKLLGSVLKQKIDEKHGKQIVISITGRPLGGKELFMRKLVTEGAIVPTNTIGVINMADVRLPSGEVSLDKLKKLIQNNKDKQVLVVYGNEVLIVPEVKDNLKFDYNIFIESDEVDRIKKLLLSGKEKRIRKMRMENIFYRWGSIKELPGKPVSPTGLDMQRAMSDVVVNLSINGNTERPKRTWDPAVIVSNLKGLPAPVKKILQVDLRTIKHVFDEKTAGKRVAFFEPVHNAETIALAQMGMHVTVITNKKEDIKLSVEEEMRIKNAGGSVRVIWTGSPHLDNLWLSDQFDLVYVSKGSQILNPDNNVYAKSVTAVINNLINITKNNGVILLAPFEYNELFIDENQDENVELQILSNGYSQVANLDGAAGVFLRKKTKETAKESAKTAVKDIRPVDILNGEINHELEKRPVVIALDFDDLQKYSGQWDLSLFVEILRQKQKVYVEQGIPVVFAFLSTEKSTREMRNILMLRRNEEHKEFIMLGREDIESENLFSKEPAFSIATARLISMANHPLTNVIMLTSTQKRIKESASARAIVLDTSTFIKQGLFLEEIVGVMGFLDYTLLQNKIDPSLMVSQAVEGNPLFDQIGSDVSSGKMYPLRDLISDEGISYKDLRGLVIVAPRVTVEPSKMQRKVQYSHLVEQSL